MWCDEPCRVFTNPAERFSLGFTTSESVLNPRRISLHVHRTLVADALRIKRGAVVHHCVMGLLERLRHKCAWSDTHNNSYERACELLGSAGKPVRCFIFLLFVCNCVACFFCFFCMLVLCGERALATYYHRVDAVAAAAANLKERERDDARAITVYTISAYAHTTHAQFVVRVKRSTASRGKRRERKKTNHHQHAMRIRGGCARRRRRRATAITVCVCECAL